LNQESSQEQRRKRTRSLIIIGSLAEKAGLLNTFGLPLGEDFQKAPNLKYQVGALYKGFLILNEIANTNEVFLPSWGEQGLAKLREENEIRN